MADTAFRTPAIETPQVNLPAPEPNEYGASVNLPDIEPVESSPATVLMALGIDDSLKNLPESDKRNLNDVTEYITDILDNRKINPTVGAYKRVLGEIRDQMGIDPDTDPSAVLDRIGGVVKAWKSMAFLGDPREKRSLFMKLARQPDSQSMDKLIFEAMEKKKVWQ